MHWTHEHLHLSWTLSSSSKNNQHLTTCTISYKAGNSKLLYIILCIILWLLSRTTFKRYGHLKFRNIFHTSASKFQSEYILSIKVNAIRLISNKYNLPLSTKSYSFRTFTTLCLEPQVKKQNKTLYWTLWCQGCKLRWPVLLAKNM